MIKYVGLVKVSIALFFIEVISLYALRDGQCLTPPMGWNSWNHFACNNLNEQVVLSTAQAFVRKRLSRWEGQQISLKDVGYIYVNLDDCWAASSRTASGRFQVNTSKFPHCSDGTMKWLADSLHRMGLKIGIYSCAGTQTCAKTMPGSYQNETIDAQTFAEWGIDYLKYDWCNVPSGSNAPTLYSRMNHALKNAYSKLGKGYIFSICEWGSNNPWLWGDTCGHLWRTTGDINASWGSIVSIVDQQISKQLYRYAKPGGWNDPDMLEVGRGSLTLAENQAHFDLWCIQAAPLLLGNDLTTMSDDIFNIVSNREVIAVDQDSLGWQGRRVRQINNTVDVWVKKLSSKDTVQNRKYAVVLFNRGTGTASGNVTWADIGESQSNAQYIVRDLWKHQVLDSSKTEKVEVSGIPPHGTVHLLLTRKPIVEIAQRNRNGSLPNAKILGRTGAGGFEIYIPTANNRVSVYDVQGKEIASFEAIIPSWYRLEQKTLPRGTYLVRVKSADLPEYGGLFVVK